MCLCACVWLCVCVFVWRSMVAWRGRNWTWAARPACSRPSLAESASRSWPVGVPHLLPPPISILLFCFRECSAGLRALQRLHMQGCVRPSSLPACLLDGRLALSGPERCALALCSCLGLTDAACEALRYGLPVGHASWRMGLSLTKRTRCECWGRGHGQLSVLTLDGWVSRR